MARRKTDEERADEARRYEAARSANTDAEFEALLADPNQAIRNVAAMNPSASAAVLDRFADDRFWSVRVAVATHPFTSRATLLSLLEPQERSRGVVHHETCRRLEAEGVRFGADGMPVGD